ncbi:MULTISPECIES: oxidoreductase [unclassified Curtobacterium]|uniref:oxidoreductase n=1 Tax=unclassified Curtobacterium TaxID=257496 RepID=UPI000F471D2C|nr:MULTISPECIES: oxidoreductase [unclassified Curtobacterium]ROQ07722.1 aryl-alcohol dehydrogenase-like predicted oxidoreductase [Curtobacterium sp. PhB171]ROQ23667.1 aryl-alcohol dehydrogenase-like predicted oxidoreductase [Curtobacterium sp. PhB170]ROS35581.1 aryl-alcohol dehydrogenase-like predicted oxidoreductase [Curtobacterium sp. PhB131]ROS69690.1 aryl-alcohol dehydrogenase-like predicted oxidoreductase [Curtobacterium sp. PhB141]
MSTTTPHLPGGTWTLGDRPVARFGYGAMQLAGPRVVGPPKDHDEAVAVLRDAVAGGITHIDTAETYGPRVVNELLNEALHPYADGLVIATKVGARRDARGGWPTARKPDELRAQVDDNLETLGVDVLDLVNLRLGDANGPVAEPIAPAFETLVDLQRQGVIRHLGVSNATTDQVAEAQGIAPIVSVQNMYNLAIRQDDPLIDRLAAEGVAYVPFFPLGGFAPLQSEVLSTVATRLGSTPMSVALAWLLRRSPNILLIPGTSSRAHLQENIEGAAVVLSDDDLLDLEGIGG